jgi:hypothetical protein
MTETDIIDRLWASVAGDGEGPSKDLAVEAADEIERLRKHCLLAPSISWDGFLVSGMQESIDEVRRLIDLERRGHQ